MSVICVPSASHAQSRSANDPAVGTAEIIVTGRRPRIIAEKDVAETVPPDVIKIYATDSIGELLDRLSTRFGSNFSIVVNGRRLASNDAINALPPEALQQIQVLTPIKAREFGLPTAQTVINLELRPKFQFLAAEGNGSMATDGAGDAETSTLRYSRIRNDQRLTAALTLLHQGGIRQRDRFRSTAPENDRSLIPSQDTITFTGGYGRPLGALNFDFSADAGITRSKTLTGVVAAASGSNGYQASHQENGIRFLRASTTLGGQIGSYFLSLQINGERSWTTIRNLAGNKHMSPDLNSASASFSGTLTASGTLFQVPAGPVTIDGALGGTTSDITVRQGNAAGQQNSPHYSSLSGQAGITLPITRKGQGMLGAIGDLSVGGRLDYSQASAFGQSIAVTSTLDWTVFEGLRISLSRASSPGLPAASAVLAPIVMRPGTLVYDASLDAVVPVTIITGGRDTLTRSASSATNISAEFHKSTPVASMTASLNYMASETTNPVISISNPSPLAQQIFPGLFIRDASGTLVEFDARPFNALRQTNREIALSLRLSGRLGGKSVDIPSDGTKVRTATNERAGPVWDLGVTYSYMLQRRLVLGTGQGSIDVLANPLALTGTPRGRLNLQWALGWKKFGANGSVSWESGTGVQAIDDLAGAPVRYSPLTKVGLEIFAELARSSALDNPASLRVKVGVDNIFNQRLRVTGIPGYDNAVQRILSDPYGRTVKVSIRKAF